MTWRRSGPPSAESWTRSITGTDLLSLGLTGPRIGQTLAALLDRVLEEPSLNNREALLALVRKMA